MAAVACLGVALAYVAFGREHVQMVLAAVAGLEALALCVFRPRQALLVFAGFWGLTHVLLSNGEVEGGGGSISQLVGVTVVVGFGMAAARLYARRSLRIPFALRALGAFTVLYGVAELITPLRHAGLSDLMKLTGAFVLALVAWQTIDDERRLLRLSGIVTLVGVLVAGVALAQYASGSSLGLGGYTGSDGVYRATSALGSANGTADFLLVCAGFALLRYTLRRDRLKPRADLLALCAIATGILVTFTRADVIALSVMLVVWAGLWQVRSVGAIALRARLALIFLVAAVGVVQLVGGSALLSRLEGRLHPNSQASVLNGREEIWSSELAKLKTASANTVLVGSGAHTSYTNIYVPQSEALREFPPHDLFLWLLVETGLIGLAVYCVALLSTGRSLLGVARRLRYSPRGRVAAVAFAVTVAFVVDSMFHNTQLSTGSYWYFMLFLGATLRVARAQ